jgi:hypothetical protein
MHVMVQEVIKLFFITNIVYSDMKQWSWNSGTTSIKYDKQDQQGKAAFNESLHIRNKLEMCQ